MNPSRETSSACSELRWLSQQIRPLLYLHLSSFVCITAGSVLGLLTPLVFRWLIDRIIPTHNAILLIGAMFLVFLGSEGKTAVTGLGGYLMVSAAQRMSLSLRMKLLLHLDSLSADYYDRTPVGEIVYAFREPIEEIAYFASDLVPAILRTLLTTGFTLITMLALSPALTLIVVPFVPIFLVFRQHFRKKLSADSDAAQSDRIDWTSFLEEHLAAAIPIQLLGRQKRQERQGFCRMARSVRSQVKLVRTSIWFSLSASLAIVLAMSMAIGLGAWSVVRGDLTLGTLVAFYSFVAQLFEPLNGAAEVYSRAQKAFASVRQVRRVLSIASRIADGREILFLSGDSTSQIELIAVEFGYARQKRMLRVPSLQIAPGEKLVISGENGAGKSTLAKLIARLYDVDSGQVRIAGKDVRATRLESLRACVCYLTREPVLFDGTLASNLRFVSPGASETDLRLVVEKVGLSDFVASLPRGLQQKVGPGACQLSGGQRQRLAIARALLQRPKILILDEATSCIDARSENVVLQNVFRHLLGATIILISHRPTIPRNFSRNLVIAGGEIVADARAEMIEGVRCGCIQN